MSSTNRGNSRDSHISDYYVTPLKPIRDLMEFLRVQEETRDIFQPRRYMLILDPCAGGDEKNPMSYPIVLKEYAFAQNDNVFTQDIREDSLADRKEDFLSCKNDMPFDIIITNPPFNIAEEVVTKALDICVDGGFVIMLLRLNFFGSKKRENFWKNNMPILTVVHRERISFTIGGGTNSIEYMHCIWKKGVKQDFTKLSII